MMDKETLITSIGLTPSEVIAVLIGMAGVGFIAVLMLL